MSIELIYNSDKSAVKEVLRILRQEDPDQTLNLYWHYWSGSPMEMMAVLETYGKKVNMG